MSSTDSETAPARPTRRRALLALFGVAMFALGVGIGGLGLPRLLAPNPAVTPQASVVAQVPLATATATVGATATPAATATAAAAAPPTATTPPPIVTVAPTATTPAPTATVPVPTAMATGPPSSIFAPDPGATATTTATAPTAAAGTATVGPTLTATVPSTATATATAISVPTVTPTSATFAATDRVNTEIPVNFRAGPGTTYAAQTALSPGTLLAATGEAATVDGVAWRQFSLANGTIGWVRSQDVLAVR
jgi:hypothetical protein